MLASCQPRFSTGGQFQYCQRSNRCVLCLYTHKRHSKRQGFTIVELLIVIVVIAILAAISIVAFTGIQNRSYDSAIQSDLNNLAKKIELAAADSGLYPPGGSGSGSSLAFPNFAFSPSKPAYYMGSQNLTYCTGPDSSSGEQVFQIRAKSKSGSTFSYRSGSGLANLGNGHSYSGNSTSACEGINTPRTWAYGYRFDTQTWNGWINQ